MEDLETVVTRFGDIYLGHMTRAFARRLGIKEGDAGTLELASALLPALTKAEVPFEQFFFDHYGGKASRPSRPVTTPELLELSNAIQDCPSSDEANPKHPYFKQENPQAMLIDEVEELWAHIDGEDNWQPLYDKIKAVREIQPLFCKTKSSGHR